MLRIPSHALSTLSGPDDLSNGISHALCCLRAALLLFCAPLPSLHRVKGHLPERSSPPSISGPPPGPRYTSSQRLGHRPGCPLPRGIGLSPIPGTKHTSFSSRSRPVCGNLTHAPGTRCICTAAEPGFWPEACFLSHMGRTEWSSGASKPHGALRVLAWSDLLVVGAKAN